MSSRDRSLNITFPPLSISILNRLVKRKRRKWKGEREREGRGACICSLVLFDVWKLFLRFLLLSQCLNGDGRKDDNQSGSLRIIRYTVVRPGSLSCTGVYCGDRMQEKREGSAQRKEGKMRRKEGGRKVMKEKRNKIDGRELFKKKKKFKIELRENLRKRVERPEGRE